MSNSCTATGRTAVIAGLGSWLPPDVVTNDDISARLNTSDEWIRTRTGIARRHAASAGMATSDLAVEAGCRALKSADSPEVDAVILATSTPDYPTPATAPAVAARLGFAGVAAFDLVNTCAGFVYGLATAAGLIAAGAAERVLLIGAEVLSKYIDPADRTLVPIMADGAGAVVLRAGAVGEPGAVGRVFLGSDGEFSDLLRIPGGGSRQRRNDRPAEPGAEFLRMQGREIFRHSVVRMAESSERALSAAGWRTADVDRVVAHQANGRIIAALGTKLDVPADRVLTNIDHVGNTSAASVPLLLSEAAADGRLRPGHRVLLTAFGGGLAWGSTTLVWPELPGVHS